MRIIAIFASVLLAFATCAYAESESVFELGALSYTLKGEWESSFEITDDTKVNHHFKNDTEQVIVTAVYDDFADTDPQSFYELFAVEMANGSTYDLEAYPVANAEGCLLITGITYDVGEDTTAMWMYLDNDCFYTLSYLSTKERIANWTSVILDIGFYTLAKEYDLSSLSDSELSSLLAEATISQIVASVGNPNRTSRFIDVDYSKLSDEEFELLLNTIKAEQESRENSVESAVSKMDNFFIACAQDGIYFSATKPASEMPGAGNVDTLVRYESSAGGVAYDPFIRRLTDGNIEYGISSSCYYSSTNKAIFENFVSIILEIENDEAAMLLDDWFMQSYLSDDTATISSTDYEIQVSFTDTGRFVFITVK